MLKDAARYGPGRARLWTEIVSTTRAVLGRMVGPDGLLRTRPGFALLSGAVAAIIGVNIGLIVWHNRQSALEEHRRSMNTMGIVLVEQTSRYVQVIDLMLHEVQTHIDNFRPTTPADFQHHFESDEAQSYLAERVKNVPQVGAIALVNADGLAFNSSRDRSVLPDATDRDYYGYFKTHHDPGLFIGSISKSRDTGQLSLFFARRVSGSDGTFLGLVLGIVQTKFLTDFYQAAGEHSGETIALFRRDGTMLLRYPDPERAAGLKLTQESPWYKSVSEGGGSYTDTPALAGVVSLISAHLLRDYPLVVTIAIGEADAFAQWRKETVYIASFALPASLAFAGLCWMLGRQFRQYAEQNDKLAEAGIRLSEREEILRSYAEMSADWFWEQDANSRFKFDSAIPFVIASDDTGKTRRDLADPAMAEERWAMHEADLAAQRPFRNFRWERLGSDGESHFISTNGDPAFDRNGTFTGYRGTGRDVTVEIRANARLAQANSDLELGRQQFDAVLSNISQGVCFFNAEKRLRLCNPRYAEIYKLSPEATRPGQSLEAIMRFRDEVGSASDLSADEYLVWWDQIVASKQAASSVVSLKDGRFISIHYQFMPDGGWVATHEDITERHQAEASIMFMARHDALTKLPNRVLFRERMEKAIAMTGHGTQFAVFCLDLDRFKHVNDTMGHPVGDALLVAVAERLRACVRGADTVGRLGGDEFAIIQIAVRQPDDAEILASRIIDAFVEPFEVDGHQIMSGVSIGVAVAPSDGVSYETLMRDADIALYLAKTERRGAVRFFEPEMDSRIHLRRLLEQDLRDAIVRNEFELYYQPQVNLISNKVFGFEALLRWHHPLRGSVSPLEFVPVAEETGMIVEIGEWVLRTACFEAENWPLDVSVAVNLSPIQFNKGDLVATGRGALESSGLRSDRLELEITESVFLSATVDTMRKLRELRAMGISKITIDQSFVRDLTTNKDSVLIVRAIHGLGQSLGMTTIAEGVETLEQLNQLRELGCTEVQGYFFGRPRPASDVAAICDKFRMRSSKTVG